jgi:hypothetical protein
MPQIIKNEAGEDVEVYTKEELEAESDRKAEAERSRIEAEKEAEKSDIQAKLEETQEALEKEKQKEKNFKNLRDKSDKGDGKVEELANTVKTLQEQLNIVTAQPIATAKKSFIEKHIGADKEAVDKFNLHFQKVGKDAKSDEEVSVALQEALILTTGGKTQAGSGNNNGRVVTTGADNSNGGSQGEESEASKEFAKAFGITEEDKKKHGKNQTNLF